MYGFIYMTTNTLNGRKYIGQKKYDKNGKWKNYLGSGRALREAIKKYGKENFKREIIVEAKTFQELDDLEKYYINLYNANTNDDFYNLVEGGGTVTGLILSKETKLKLSKIFSGDKNYFYGKHFNGETNPFYGRHHTEASRKKMSESSKGQIPWNKGRTGVYSEESLNRMIESGKKYKPTEETKRKISEAIKGDKHPLYGKHRSAETRKKIGKHQMKKVMCITTNKVFESIKEAGEFYKLNSCYLISQQIKGRVKYAGKLNNGTKLEWKYI